MFHSYQRSDVVRLGQLSIDINLGSLGPGSDRDQLLFMCSESIFKADFTIGATGFVLIVSTAYNQVIPPLANE